MRENIPMKSKAIFMALLAFAFGAQAASVSDATARLAARSWARSDASFGLPHGTDVSKSSVYEVNGTNGFYVVSLTGGGTLLVAADDEMDPILGFTTASEVDLSSESPLRNLLNRDIAARRGRLAAEASGAQTQQRKGPLLLGASASASASAAGTSAARARKLWAAFTSSESGQSSGGRVRLGATATPRKSLAASDIRVFPLLTTQWSQTRNKSGQPCYNYYTPNHWPCGCVATAAGQIVYYWKWPQGTLEKFSNDKCTVGGATKTLWSQGESRTYNWDAMSSTVTEDGCQAIGALLYDLGVAFSMGYSASGSGAFEENVPGPLHEHFNYASAYTYTVNGTGTKASRLHEADVRQKVVLANLDARRPVELYILSDDVGGHAVVADGYGYVTIDGEEVEFTHINMGWAGSDDMWYNLPVINTDESGSQEGQSGGYDFKYLMGATFNIHPTETGELLTGRITGEYDGEYSAISNATVAVYRAGEVDSPIAVTNSDERGIYCFVLPGGKKYDIVATSVDGRRTGSLEEVSLAKTMISSSNYVTKNDMDIGNSWGNDIFLEDPRVRIVTSDGTNSYSTLDRAFAGARSLAAASPGLVPELEILADVNLGRAATIDFDCVVRAATGDESSTIVNRPNGSLVTVATNACLILSNCDFQVTGTLPFKVDLGGKLRVGPGFSAEKARTEDASGFGIIGYITCDLAMECTAATKAGDVFGVATTDDVAALSNSLARIYATFDDTRETRGRLGPGPDSAGKYSLVWDNTVPIPVGSSVGYFVTSDGATNTFGRVDRLFARFDRERTAGLIGDDPEIVVIGCDDKGLSANVNVAGKLSIRGEGGARILAKESSHIVFGNGGNLTMKNVIVGDRTEGTDLDTFVRIGAGDSLTSLTLQGGAVFTNLVCAGNRDGLLGGPIAVLNGGSLRLEPGSAIVGCSAIGNSDYYGAKRGGGVYLKGGATLDLAGGSITGCSSKNYFGGGVYAEQDAKVIVSGPSVVSGNVDKNGAADDIYFFGSASYINRLSVTNAVSAGSIGVMNKYAMDTGLVFAEATSAEFATNSAAAFFCDGRPFAAVVTNVAELVWAEAPPPAPPVAEFLVAEVVLENGTTVTNETLEAAFDYLGTLEAPGEVTVLVYSNCTFTSDIVVPPCCTAMLCSVSGTVRELTRSGDVSIVVGDGASLSVTNLVFTDAGFVMDEDRLFLLNLAEKPFFSVEGGSLELLDGAVISGVAVYGCFGAAVSVTDGAAAGGTFTMRDGSLIADCTNYYDNVDMTAFSGGVLVDGRKSPRAYLVGGSVTNCLACRVGGVYVGNTGEIYVSGGVNVTGNYAYGADGSEPVDANLSVSASASLYLEDVLTGSVGVRYDVRADKVVFGRVGDAFSGSDDDLVSSAMNFLSDDGKGYGMPISSGTTNLLAWSEMLVLGETYDYEGETYSVVSSSTVKFKVPLPEAVTNLVYDGTEKTGVKSGNGCVLSGTFAATNAGAYTATATLKAGYEWADGSSGEKSIDWEIAKATYDMSGVSFESVAYIYDGTIKSLEISGECPEGVTVSYSAGNSRVSRGMTVVTASFHGDAANYEAIPDMIATLYVVEPVARPTAIAGLVYNGSPQAGVASAAGYTLLGDVTGTDAGTNYTTVVHLDDYMVWNDDKGGYSMDDIEIVWSIAPSPLKIRAKGAWKLVGASDPTFTYVVVSGLQGGDKAADVLEGELTREPGEALNAEYGIQQGSLKVKSDNPNYRIETFTTAYLKILDTEPKSALPDLPASPTPADVAAALTGAGLVDGDVADAINGADDPVAAYNDFKDWADTVNGGAEAVAASDKAWVSYEFGVTDLFVNEPSVTFTSMAIEDPATASMNVKLVVKDGTMEKADVNPDSVAKLFEMSANLVTWTDDVTATPNPDGSYTVAPKDTSLKAAFIRLKY